MIIKDKYNIDELDFGIMLYPMNYTKGDERRLERHNLFASSRVKWSVARYVTMPLEERKQLTDPLHFCFGDTWGRCEYEFVVSPWIGGGEDGYKVDTFEMYVRPNRELLMEIIDRVSVTSAKKYLSQKRKYRKETK